MVRVGLLAAAYVALTMLFAPWSFGLVQVRVSEMLTVLPYVMPAATPGLFIGCLVANILGGLGVVDVVLGSSATLLAAFLTSKMPAPWLAPLPPVLVNALVVAWYLSVWAGVPYWMGMLSVFAGQVVACYVLGYPLLVYIMRHERLREYLK
ncbi:MAG: QueT transporter family protein [Bacillota bacterium]